MNKRKAILGGVVALMLLAAAAWGFGLFGGTDPAVAQLQQLGSQMWDKNLPDDQRGQLRDQFRQQMQSLTEDQRRAFFESSRPQWEARGQQRMNEFFAMSKADQQKRLDQILDDMQKRQASGNSQQNGGQNARGGGGGGNRGSMTAAQREERSKRRIENTSPEGRAQFAQFRKMLDQRAQQRGMKVDPGRGGFGGPRGA